MLLKLWRAKGIEQRTSRCSFRQIRVRKTLPMKRERKHRKGARQGPARAPLSGGHWVGWREWAALRCQAWDHSSPLGLSWELSQALEWGVVRAERLERLVV